MAETDTDRLFTNPSMDSSIKSNEAEQDMKLMLVIGPKSRKFNWFQPIQNPV
jgi:hypothetical protein